MFGKAIHLRMLMAVFAVLVASSSAQYAYLPTPVGMGLGSPYSPALARRVGLDYASMLAQQADPQVVYMPQAAEPLDQPEPQLIYIASPPQGMEEPVQVVYQQHEPQVVYQQQPEPQVVYVTNTPHGLEEPMQVVYQQPERQVVYQQQPEPQVIYVTNTPNEPLEEPEPQLIHMPNTQADPLEQPEPQVIYVTHPAAPAYPPQRPTVVYLTDPAAEDFQTEEQDGPRVVYANRNPAPIEDEVDTVEDEAPQVIYVPVPQPMEDEVEEEEVPSVEPEASVEVYADNTVAEVIPPSRADPDPAEVSRSYYVRTEQGADAVVTVYPPPPPNAPVPFDVVPVENDEPELEAEQSAAPAEAGQEDPESAENALAPEQPEVVGSEDAQQTRTKRQASEDTAEAEEEPQQEVQPLHQCLPGRVILCDPGYLCNCQAGSGSADARSAIEPAEDEE